MNFFQVWLVMLLVAAIPLILYSISKCGKDFDIISFILATRTRLILGFFLILLLSALVVFVPEAELVLTAIGFNADRSSAALGLAIGGLLISGIRGDEEK